MSNYDQLYELFQQEKAAFDRQKFNAFMSGFESELIEDLNKYWKENDKTHYDKLLNNIKKQGMRVFRNASGEHKIQFI